MRGGMKLWIAAAFVITLGAAGEARADVPPEPEKKGGCAIDSSEAASPLALGLALAGLALRRRGGAPLRAR